MKPLFNLTPWVFRFSGLLGLAIVLSLTTPGLAHKNHFADDSHEQTENVSSPPASAPSSNSSVVSTDPDSVLIKRLVEQRARQHHQEMQETMGYWMRPHKLEPIVFPPQRVKSEQPFNQGLAFMQSKDYSKAIAEFDKAVQIDPTYDKAWMNQGDAYMELGQYKEAIASYDQAIAHHKTFSRLYLSRGKAYAALKDYKTAILDYDRALTVYPEDPIPYYHRGQASYQLGQYDQADQDWQNAIDRFVNFYQAYRARGDMRQEQGNATGALEDYQKAVTYAHNDAANAGAAEVESHCQQQLSKLQAQWTAPNLYHWFVSQLQSLFGPQA